MMKTMLLAILVALPLAAGGKPLTVAGKVATVEEDYCGKSIDYVLNAAIATKENKVINLVLAPKWYLLSRQIDIKVGTELEATVLMQSDGTALVIQLKLGGKTHPLRNAKGRPLWKAEPGSEDLFKTICSGPGKNSGG